MGNIITISREFGAGGGEIGRKLASALGYEYYDKALILKAATMSNIDAKQFVEWDEKVPVEFGFAQSLFNFYNKPVSEKIFEAQKTIVRQIAEKRNCIIVGRNGAEILREYDHCLHVFVHADLQWRFERMRDKMPDVPDKQKLDDIKKVDKARNKYCEYYTKRKFRNADNYDLTLSTSKLGIDACVSVILNALEKID